MLYGFMLYGSGIQCADYATTRTIGRNQLNSVFVMCVLRQTQKNKYFLRFGSIIGENAAER